MAYLSAIQPGQAPKELTVETLIAFIASQPKGKQLRSGTLCAHANGILPGAKMQVALRTLCAEGKLKRVDNTINLYEVL